MKTPKIAIMAAILSLSAAVPALAAFDNIGSIDVGGQDFGRGRGPGMNRDMRGPGRMDRDVKIFNLGGPVEKLQLRAERSDVNCRSVDASFGNGQTRNIFSGRLREGRTTDVDLPGRDRSIRALNFDCSAERGQAATIRIVADVGRYRTDWQRNPDWQRTWARMFNWGSNTVNNWQMIGSETFDGRSDRETSYAGRRGLHVDAIALRPLESDARCSRVTARFDNGRSQNLALHNGDLLRRGEYAKLDLPGDTRNVASLDLTCRAVGANRVTVQLFTSH